MRDIQSPEPTPAVDRLALALTDACEGAEPAFAPFLVVCFDSTDAD